MYHYSQKEKAKAEATQLSLKHLNINTEHLLTPYLGQTFRQSDQEKAALFSGILNGVISLDSYRFMVERLGRLQHHRDRRPPEEYGAELVRNWLIEDAVALALKREGASVSLGGSDSGREFLDAGEILTTADLTIGTNARPLELMTDLSGCWRNHNHCDLRDDKFRMLVQKKALLLGLSPLSGEGFCLSLHRSSGFVQNRSIKGFGGKPGYTHHDIAKELQPLSAVVQQLVHYGNEA